MTVTDNCGRCVQAQAEIKRLQRELAELMRADPARALESRAHACRAIQEAAELQRRVHDLERQTQSRGTQ